MDFGKTVEKGNLPCRASQAMVKLLGDGTRLHEGQKESVHLPLLSQGRVPCQPLVCVSVSKQSLDFPVILVPTHHHCDDLFVSMGDSNGAYDASLLSLAR